MTCNGIKLALLSSNKCDRNPSFIKASDFRSPADLANYLLFLDSNPFEYDKYKSWRFLPNPFTEEYLAALKYRVPGPLESSLYSNYTYPQRTTACCRLCDENYVKWATAERKLSPNKYSHKLRETEIESKYFGKIFPPKT